VSGVRMPGQNLRYWLGVPYADTTGPGPLSWLPPRERPHWTGTLDGSEYGPGCWQTHHNPDVPKNQSYDCLNVNIYAPITDTPVGVMVFWHGGTFVEGSDQGPFGMYNGSLLASTQNVVVVTMNYRLGSFGFLVTDKLDGNFGFLDQQFGLGWVQVRRGFGGYADGTALSAPPDARERPPVCSWCCVSSATSALWGATNPLSPFGGRVRGQCPSASTLLPQAPGASFTRPSWRAMSPVGAPPCCSSDRLTCDLLHPPHSSPLCVLWGQATTTATALACASTAERFARC
jgi:hypothetical protein